MDRFQQLRQLLDQKGLDYYFIPSSDAHNNEYPPACWQRRQWLTGFTGSVGELVVGMEEAFLWTDSRYYLQAQNQLDSRIIKMRKLQKGEPSLTDWLKELPRNIKLGVDPRLITIAQTREWSKWVDLIPLEENLVDAIWKDRPPLPQSPILKQPEEYAGVSVEQKLALLRAQMKHCDAHILVKLDQIAWLFNMRGSDIEYNPMKIAYAIITQTDADLYVGQTYEQFGAALNGLRGRVWVDETTTSWWIQRQLSQSELVLGPSPVSLLKAVKNEAEQIGMKEAHRLDAIAVIRFLHWIEQYWREGEMDELTAAEQLRVFRFSNQKCVDLSFPTISAFGENGAIVHYRPAAETNKKIDDSTLYLIDSGGQYVCGTTDITRVIHLGEPTPDQKRHYTWVLKGHLALRHTIFPKGSCGYQLDGFARQFLWRESLNYGHGTGHGVGCYLSVHEGPQNIRPEPNPTCLDPGMVVSNEPGVYFTGMYGIRIENLCLIVPHSEGFLRFEDLTQVPYARNLLDRSLLTQEEIAWINEYHKEVFDHIAPFLTEEVRQWLQTATSPI